MERNLRALSCTSTTGGSPAIKSQPYLVGKVAVKDLSNDKAISTVAAWRLDRNRQWKRLQPFQHFSRENHFFKLISEPKSYSPAKQDGGR